MKALVAHPGTQHSQRLAVELHRRNALQCLYTGVAFSSDSVANRAWRMLPSKWQRHLANRRIEGLPPGRLHARPLGEVYAHLRLRLAGTPQEVWHQRAEQFQRSIPDAELLGASSVIAFDTAGWILCQRCAAHQIPFVLDQTTPHPDAKLPLYALVQEQYPAWSNDREIRRRDVRQAEQLEHDGASCIVAASSFTQKSLVEHSVCRKKIRVNPYGVDCSQFHIGERSATRPMRFIFVGLISARKGVPLLLDAWRDMSDRGAELWIVGSASPTVRSLLPDLPGVRYVGGVPHDEVAGLMRQCDVLVFPSYFEGFGLVLLEAMACGLPVITTTATAGPDIVTPGEDGWIMEPGDLPSLIERMRFCLDCPEIVREMGMRAQATAERFTWSEYGERWLQILAETCEEYKS